MGGEVMLNMSYASAGFFIALMGFSLPIILRVLPSKKVELSSENKNLKMQIPEDFKEFLKSMTDIMHKHTGMLSSSKDTGERTHKKMDDMRTDGKETNKMVSDIQGEVGSIHEKTIEIKTALSSRA